MSFTIRKESEPLNRSGVNRVRVDPVTRRLFSAGRDSIIRFWDIDNVNNNKEVSDYNWIECKEQHLELAWRSSLFPFKIGWRGDTIDTAACSIGMYLWCATPPHEHAMMAKTARKRGFLLPFVYVVGKTYSLKKLMTV